MAHGTATGWAEWQGQRYTFENAPAYAEKNWGGAFPERWFWIQGNAFPDVPDLTVTAAGGLRQVLGRQEAVGLVGIHFRGQFIAVGSLAGKMTWNIAPWGAWSLMAQDHRYRITLSGKAKDNPAVVRVPTLDGLRFGCWDTTHGHLHVQVWQRSRSGSDTLMLIAHLEQKLQVVGGNEQRFVRLLHKANQAATGAQVQAGGGLIVEQYPRAHG